MARKKFIMIDGSAVLSTMYYANLPRSIKFAKTEEDREKYYKDILQTSTGVYTNGVFGSLKMMLKIIKEQKPDYFCVAFDKSRNTFRKKMYDAYKGQRKATPAPLKEQFVTLETILERIGIPVFMSDDFEADDLIGSLAKKFSPEAQTFLLTKDHDYLQLIDENTRVWMLTTKDKQKEMFEKYNLELGLHNIPDNCFEYTDTYVLAEEGVHAHQIMDLRGIMGGTSDNIPGVKGVASAAIPLLAEYGTVEGIYEAIESAEGKAEEKELTDFWKTSLEIKRSPLNALKRDKEMAFLSKELATIKTDIPFDLELSHFVTNIDSKGFAEVVKEFEFNSLKDFQL